MGNEKKHCIETVEKLTVENPVVTRAESSDIEGIMDVACSVGNKNKVHTAGFLMDDYIRDYDFFKNKFLQLINELDHFYVIQDNKILGFLIAYKKEEWLRYNPEWIEDIVWNPSFDLKKTEKFILIDKTAILSGLTGRGLGSLLYKTLIQDVKQEEISDIYAETIISPKPNFASLEFRIKQKYSLAGVRFEDYKGVVYTDLIYHKEI